MIVKDEADVVGFTIEHLLGQVDHVYVADNLSTDGTWELLHTLPADCISISRDEEVGYWQSRKTTDLAMRALEEGHEWVVPCDADEWWVSQDGRTVKQTLEGLSPDVMVVTAPIYHYLPTSDDGSDGSPFERIGWRLREHAVLPKVACRLRPELTILAGNHGANYDDQPFLISGGLIVRHYSWRSAEQYVRKIRNGAQAYAATDLEAHTGSHWRVFPTDITDVALATHFRKHFWRRGPSDYPDLVYDPAL